jgi:hypothetical protein
VRPACKSHLFGRRGGSALTLSRTSWWDEITRRSSGNGS